MSRILYKEPLTDSKPINVSGKRLSDIRKKYDPDFYSIYKNSVLLEADYDEQIDTDAIYHIVPRIAGGDNDKILGAIALGILIVATGGYATTAFSGLFGTSVGGALGSAYVSLGTGLVTGGIYALANKPTEPGDASISPLVSQSNPVLYNQQFPYAMGRIKWTPPIAAQPDYGTDKTQVLYYYGLADQAIDIISPTNVVLGADSFPLERKRTPGNATLTQDNQEAIHTTGPNINKIGYKLTTIFRRKDGKNDRVWGDIYVYYREVGSQTWLNFRPPPYQKFLPDNENAYWLNGRLQISGKLKHPKNSWYDVKDVPPAQYEIKIVLPRGTGSKRERTVNIDFFEEYTERTDVYNNHKYFSYTFSKDAQGTNKVDIITQSKTRIFDFNTNQWIDDQPTSNPAWWLYDLLRGRRIDNFLVYGFGYDDTQIDLDSIKAWAQYCDANGLEVNYVVPPAQKRSETINIILGCGRGQLSFHTGKLGVVFNQQSDLVEQNIDITNIVGGLSVEYIRSDLKRIEGTFLNKDNDYRPETIRVDVTQNPFDKFQKVDLVGITNYNQAQKALIFALKAVENKKRLYKFKLLRDNFFSRIGSRLRLSHTLTETPSARVASGSTTSTIKLLYPIEQPSDYTHCLVTFKDGHSETVAFTPSGNKSDTINLIDTLTAIPEEFDAHITIGKSQNNIGEIVRIVDLQIDNDTVLVSAINDPDAVYDETGTTTQPPKAPAQKPEIISINITESNIRSNGNVDLDLSFDTNAATFKTEIWYRFNEALPWQFLADPTSDQYSFTVSYLNNSRVFFRFKPIGLLEEGDFVYHKHDITGMESNWRPPAVTRLRLQGDTNHNQIFEGKSFIVEWEHTSWDVPEFGDLGDSDNNTLDQEFSHYEVSVYDENLNLLRTVTTTTPQYRYTSDDMILDGLHRTVSVSVKQVSRAGQKSDAKFILLKNPQIGKGNITQVEAVAGTKSVLIHHDISAADLQGIRVYYSSSSLSNPTTGTYIESTENPIKVMLPSVGTWYFRIAGFDTFGDDNLSWSDEASTTVEKINGLDINNYDVIDKALNDEGFLIVGDNIAANTISAKNLYLTDWTNLIAEPRDPDSWPAAGFANGYHTNDVRTSVYGLGDIEIDPQEAYRASLTVRADGSNLVPAGLTFLVMDENKNGIAWRSFQQTPSAANTDTVVSGKDLFNGLPNARFVRPYLFLDIPNGTTHPHTYSYKDIRLHRMSNGNLIVDGSITANNLNVDAIDSNTGKIKALHVETLMIKDNAVTVPTAVTDQQRRVYTIYDGTNNSAPSTTQTHTVLAMNVQSEGEPLLITITGTAWGQYGGISDTLANHRGRELRISTQLIHTNSGLILYDSDTVVVNGYLADGNQSGVGGAEWRETGESFAGSFLHTPPAGVHTYELKMTAQWTNNTNTTPNIIVKWATNALSINSLGVKK